MLNIIRIRHDWPESAGFDLTRPHGVEDAVLLHFHNSVRVYFDGEWHETAPGAFIIFSAGKTNRFISLCPLVHDWMHLTGDVEGALAPFGLKQDTLYQPGCTKEITELVSKLEIENYAKKKYVNEYCNALLTELWIMVSRNLSNEPFYRIPQGLISRLRAIRADIIKTPERQWSSEMIAAQLGVSVPALYPIYKQTFSISPNQDVIQVRIEKAKTLLQSGDSVASVREQLGYANVYHFIRQFKQHTGMTPGQYAESIEQFKPE